MLEAEVLDLPCYHSNPELARNIETWMAEYLAKNDSSPLVNKVRGLLLERIIYGEIGQAVIADELAMSTRALQRGLKQEGHSFRELFENARLRGCRPCRAFCTGP